MNTATDTTELQHPDARLIRLGGTLKAAWAAMDALPQYSDDVEAAFDRYSAIVKQIEAVTPHTLEGFGVKALAIQWCHCGGPVDLSTGPAHENPTTDIRLAHSIIADLAAITSGTISN